MQPFYSQKRNTLSHSSSVLFLFLFLLMGFYSHAQQAGDSYVMVDSIEIEGNRWTKDYIVFKELDFESGDTLLLHHLISRFESNRNRLLNTGLFNVVEINITNWDHEKKTALIQIKLVENWFWYPSPIFELGDRSINEWYYEHNASFKRLNWGIRFMHINLTGNGDKLKFNFHGGFTQKYEVDYTYPYLLKNRNLGGYFNMMYTTHKEIAYETRNNKLNFIRSEDEFMLTRFRTSAGLNFRINKQRFQSFILEFNRKTVSDTISSFLNPEYFNTNESLLRHIRVQYHFKHNDVDKNIYPRKGIRYAFTARKDGGIFFNDLNYLQLTGVGEKFFLFSDNYSSGIRFKARKTLNFGPDIPYHYLLGTGYLGDELSGYQLYVIDGADFAYLKTVQKIKMLEHIFKWGKYMPLRQFKVFHFEAWLGIHADAGYMHEKRFSEDNPFNNRILYGGGLSLNLLLYENYLFSFEYSINHLGERGFFLSGTNSFQ